MQPVEIARVVHEANRAIQVIQADPTIPVGPCWDDLDQETRDSVIDGVLNAQRGATPEESHDNWVRFKLNHGWTWGPAKDEVEKEHPLLVRYAQLPASQKVKDALFLAIVRLLSRPNVCGIKDVDVVDGIYMHPDGDIRIVAGNWVSAPGRSRRTAITTLAEWDSAEYEYIGPEVRA